MRVRDVTIARHRRGQVAKMVVFVIGGKNRSRRRFVRVLEHGKDGSEFVAWCIPGTEAAMNDTPSDPLLSASAVRTDRTTLRCVQSGEG